MEIGRSRELARAVLGNLEAHRQRIDDLNVYPVPDGDTGTNLTLTARAIVEALERSTAEGHEAVAHELSRAALMGARGNSGVIFSQIVRGFAEVLAEHDEIDSRVLAAALRSASDAAYRAVRRPVEGTMLTVIREMAEEAEAPGVRDLAKEEFLRRVIARGEDALARTPEMLDVLRDAGVVDAGGAGIVEIVRGLLLGVTGEAAPEAPVAGEELSFDAVHQELSRYRYCTVFVVEGEELDRDVLERSLEPLGDSLLVVGDPSALKVHVHTDDPGRALSLGVAVGVVEGIEIANMHRQTEDREERLIAAGPPPPAVAASRTGIVAVVPGAGNRRLFEENGASVVIEGGQTMNPSTADIVEAIEATPAESVIVLPNNGNVILAAEQAVPLTEKTVHVVPTRSVPEGLASLIGYVSERDAEENVRAMREAADAVTTGEITRATRDASIDGIAVREGEWLGLVNERAVATGASFEEVADRVLDRLVANGCATLTLVTGQEAPDVDGLVARVEAEHPRIGVQVLEGGQPHYPLLLGAE